MTSSLAQRVIDLNNEAIAASLKDMRQDAVLTLQRALATLLTFQEAPSTTTTTAPKVAGNASQDIELTSSYSVPLSRTHCSKHLDDVFTFYNRAITIPTPAPQDEDMDQDDDEVACQLLSSCPKYRTRMQATLLYNLGITCHMEGVASGNSAAFGNALQFYGAAYQVLENASRTQGFPEDDSILLVLALFNNMGHIHSSFLVDSDKTRQCVSWIQSAFATPQVQQGLALDAEDYAFFCQYVSVPAKRQLLLSPAAWNYIYI